jgi:hypothetical protein
MCMLPESGPRTKANQAICANYTQTVRPEHADGVHSERNAVGHLVDAPNSLQSQDESGPTRLHRNGT